MAQVQILTASSGQKETDSNTWTTVCQIPAGSFTAGDKYLILAVSHSMLNDSAQELQMRLVHGTTPTQFTDAYEADEVLGNKVVGIGFMTVYTQPGTAEAVTLEFRASTNGLGDDHRIRWARLVAINLDDIGTQNTDYWYSEDTTDHALTTTPTDGASLTFTPNGTDKYLYIAQATWAPNDNSIEQTFHTLLYDGGVVQQVSEEGEDATNLEQRNRLLVWANTPTNASHTVKVQGRMEAGTSSTTLSSRVFALNLSKFADAHIATPADHQLAALDTWENAWTTSFTPSASQDYFVLSHVTEDYGSDQNPDVVHSLQINPDGNGLYDYPGTVKARDTFTEASTVNLSSHTADSGQSWTQEFQSEGTVRWEVVGSTDVAHIVGGSAVFGSSQSSITGLTLGDGYAEFRLVSGGDGVGVTVRLAGSGSSYNGYQLYHTGAAMGLYRVSSGAQTSLGSVTGGPWYRIYASSQSPTELLVFSASTQATLRTTFTDAGFVPALITTDATAGLQVTSGKVGIFGIYDDEGLLGGSIDDLRVVEDPFLNSGPDGGAWDAADETPWTFMDTIPFTSGASRTINYDHRQSSAGTTTRPSVVDPVFVAFSKELAGGTTTYNGSFTADAHIKKTISGTFTANAYIQKTTSGTFTADAAISKTTSGTFTADASISSTVSGSFTIDANIKRTMVYQGSGSPSFEHITRWSGTGTAITSGTISTLKSDALVLVAVHTVANASPTSITGCGLTFEQVGFKGYWTNASPSRRVEIWRAQGSPTTGTITVNYAVSRTADIRVVQFDGVAIGNNGADAIRNGGGGFTDNGGTMTATLPAFHTDGKSAGYGFGAISGGQAISAEAGWTAGTNTSVSGYSSNDTRRINTTDNTVTLNWSAPTRLAGIYAVEIRPAGFAGAGLTADAHIASTLSGSFTADATIQNTFSGTFTADAFILKTTSGTFSADAHIANTLAGSFTADAWIGSAATTYPGSFTADAIIEPAHWSTWSATWSMDVQTGQIGNFTADAYIKRTFSGSLTADAYIKKTTQGSLTADAYISATTAGTFTADAAIQNTYAGTFTADANVLAVSSGSFTADAHISKTVEQAFTADAFIFNTVSGSFTADANIVNSVNGSFTADAHISKTVAGSFTADANITNTVAGTFTADADILLTTSGTFTIDAVITRSFSGTFTADAHIAKTTEGTFTADATVQATVAGAVTADAYIATTTAGSFTADATISKTTSGTFTADAFIDLANWSAWSATWSMDVQGGVFGNFTADAHIARTFESSFSANAFIQNTFSGSVTADAFIQQVYAGAFTADADIKQTYAGSFTADAAILRTWAGAFTIDAVIQKTTEQSFVADAHISSTVAGTFTADAYILTEGTVEGSFTADANISATVESSFTADANIAKTIAGNFTADAIIQQTVAGAFTADSHIASTIAGAFTADAVIKQTYAGSFTADAEILVVQPGSFTADAEVLRIWQETFTADAHIKKTIASTFTADAIVSKTYGGTFVADAVIDVASWTDWSATWSMDVTEGAITYSGTFTADAHVKRGFTGSFSADAYVKQTYQSTVTADAHIAATIAGSFTADAEIAVTGTVTGDFTADAYVQNTLSGSFSADAYVRQTTAGTFTADAVVAVTYPGSFVADANIAATVAASFTADAWIATEGTVAGQFTADAFIKNTLSGSFTADADIQRIYAGNFTADAFVRNTFSNTFAAHANIKATLAATFTADAYVQQTTSAAVTADAYILATASDSFSVDAHLQATVAGSFTASAYITNPSATKRINSSTDVRGTLGSSRDKATLGTSTDKVAVGIDMTVIGTISTTTGTSRSLKSRLEKP